MVSVFLKGRIWRLAVNVVDDFSNLGLQWHSFVIILLHQSFLGLAPLPPRSSTPLSWQFSAIPERRRVAGGVEGGTGVVEDGAVVQDYVELGGLDNVCLLECLCGIKFIWLLIDTINNITLVAAHSLVCSPLSWLLLHLFVKVGTLRLADHVPSRGMAPLYHISEACKSSCSIVEPLPFLKEVPWASLRESILL